MSAKQIKRFTKVRVQAFEGIIQNECFDGHRMTIDVPGVKGKWWITVPNELIEVIEEDE